MKTVFDKSIRDELIARIVLLEDNCKSVWGKMNVYQMVLHCIKWEEMALGKKKYKQTFLGRLFGKMALQDFIKDETPFKRNVPTVPEFKIKEEDGNFDLQKSNWIDLIKEYEYFDNQNFVHPFFWQND